MKAYGIPRDPNVESPDCGDLREFALKSSAGHLPGKGGACRSYCQNSRSKRAVRRVYKRRARRDGKLVCAEVST